MINPILLKMLIRQIENGNAEIKDIKKEEYKEAVIKHFEEEKGVE